MSDYEVRRISERYNFWYPLQSDEKEDVGDIQEFFKMYFSDFLAYYGILANEFLKCKNPCLRELIYTSIMMVIGLLNDLERVNLVLQKFKEETEEVAGMIKQANRLHILRKDLFLTSMDIIRDFQIRESDNRMIKCEEGSCPSCMGVLVLKILYSKE